MPLTQLSTLVLPAPFGPISANSSPVSTASEMPSSTVSPPKRSESRSMASSAIPSPAAAILLDVAVAPALATAAAEIEFLDVGMAAQALGGAVEHDAAVLHHVAVVGDLERDRRALLDDQDGDAELAPDLGEPTQQVLDHDRREAERELVDQQQFRPADEGARERQHLPLAAGEEAADAGLEPAELGKELVDQRLAPPPLGVAGAVPPWRGAVFRHREIGKHHCEFRHQHDAATRVLVWQPVLDALALEADRALADARVVEAEKARDRAQRRGLAGAVGAEQRDDLAGLGLERDPLHRLERAVIDHLDFVDGEQRHRRAPDPDRCLNGHSRK